MLDDRTSEEGTTFQTISLPEKSGWQCDLFGDGNYIFWPLKGSEPNWFHRLIQRLAFGIVWRKAP